jgi:hypothetical protein
MKQPPWKNIFYGSILSGGGVSVKQFIRNLYENGNSAEAAEAS